MSVQKSDLAKFRRRGYAVAMDMPPALDGNLNATVWQKIPAQEFRSLRSFETWVDWRHRYRTPPLPGGLAAVKAGWDTNCLYLAFHCRKLCGQRRPWSGGDSVEIFLRFEESKPVCRIKVTDTGIVSCSDSVMAKQIRSKACDYALHFDLELAIPFTALGTQTPDIGDVWRTNFCRTEKPLAELTAWSLTTDYADSAGFGELIFNETAPVMRMVKGNIEDLRHNDGLVVESSSAVCFPGSDGYFEIPALMADTVCLRIGSFYHRTQLVETNNSERDVVLAPIRLERLSDDEVCRKEQEADRDVISFEQRYEDDPVHRNYQSCPSICVLPDGGLMATYTCYEGECVYNVVFVDTSYDGGRTWRQEYTLKPGYFRASWGNLWVDPLSRVWMFVQIWRPGLHNLYYTRCDSFSPGTHNWNELKLLCEDIPHLGIPIDPRMPQHIRLKYPKFINKPVVLSDGTWLAPVESNECRTRSVYALVSTDHGETWKIRGEALIAEEHREISEPMVVERRDGTLWMLIRSVHGIAESVSTDGGRTWSAFERSLIPHCSSRFFISRLRSGRLLLIKHGPMHKTVGRRDLTAFLSDDDGATWPCSLWLKHGLCTYPDVDQDKEGRIHIVYDHGRHGPGVEILHSVLNEEDIMHGKIVSPGACLNQVVARTAPG